MKSAKLILAGTLLLLPAAQVCAEYRTVLIQVTHVKNKVVVTIHSDEKKERKSAISVDEAVKVISAMQGWGSSVGVYVAADRNLPRGDRQKLFAAIDGNPWLELEYFGRAVPKNVGDHFLPANAGEVLRFPHGSYIYQIAFSPDGKLVLTDDQVWDAATGKKVATLPFPRLEQRTFPFFSAQFAPDSRHIAIHRYEDVLLVEAATGKEVWRAKQVPSTTNYRQDAPRLAFTPDGKHLLSARNDEGLIRVLSAATGKELRRFPYESIQGAGQYGAPIRSMRVSTDGKLVAVHSAVAGVHLDRPALFDLESGKELARHRISSEESWIRYSAPSPDCRHQFYAKDNAVHMIDLKTGKKVRRFQSDGKYAFLAACSPDGKQIAAGVLAKNNDKDYSIQCWEVATGKALQTIKGHPGMIIGLTYSPDGNSLLTASEDKSARLWRIP
jgi:WD40 repeat protein